MLQRPRFKNWRATQIVTRERPWLDWKFFLSFAARYPSECETMSHDTCEKAHLPRCTQATGTTEVAIQRPQVRVNIHSNKSVFTSGQPCFWQSNHSTMRRTKRLVSALIISAVFSTTSALSVKAAVDSEFRSYTELMNHRLTDLTEHVNAQMNDLEAQMLKLRDNQQ